MSFLRHEEIYRSDVRLNQSWERQPVSSLPQTMLKAGSYGQGQLFPAERGTHKVQ